MNFDRIQSNIDVERMQQCHLTVVGGAYGLTQDLVRCGLSAVTYIDYDRVDGSNPARQDFSTTEVGQYKAEAIASSLKRINPLVEIDCLIRDFCDLTRDEIDEHLGHTDLFIFATDFFPAQARGNLEALRLRKPAIWIGLYRDGRAGEIVYFVPGVTPACYRCICSSRYRAFAAAASGTANETHIPSGGTIFDLHLVDAIAGQIAVGILTAGADNRLGRLIGQLGNRNILQVKSDPNYRMGDKDIFGQYLGNHPANFSFTTIALPMEPEADCPDCAVESRTGANRMRRILRRYFIRDPAGRVISVQSERLTDDGAGRMQLQSERTARWCSGCRRPITELSELRGVCDVCHTRGCCVHCVSQCQVCSRRLCGSCRHGFAGPPALTVCDTCRQRLIARQLLQDRLMMEHTAFERYVAQQRMLNQAEMMRLAFERTRLMAHFQAARLGLNRISRLRWTMNLLGRTLAKGFQYVRRALP